MKEADGSVLVGAGFLTGGSLAIRGGFKAARNSAIGCAILLAVIEGVGIGIQRVMAENTRLDVRILSSSTFFPPQRVFVADGKNRYQRPRRLSVRHRRRWTRRVRWLLDGICFFGSEDTPLCHMWQYMRHLASARVQAPLFAEYGYKGDCTIG